jgi:hypothetical protein
MYHSTQGLGAYLGPVSKVIEKRNALCRWGKACGWSVSIITKTLSLQVPIIANTRALQVGEGSSLVAIKTLVGLQVASPLHQNY